MPSGNWDDSDAEDAVKTKAETVPLAAVVAAVAAGTPLVAAEALIDEPPQGDGQLSDDSDDDGSSVVAASYAASQDDDLEASSTLEMLDFQKISPEQALSRFQFTYDNILAEFADVEIFLISLDSLLIELSAHWYHNWTLGGQTVVLAAQIDRFLNQLRDLGGKFKLVWFSDLLSIYERDTQLNFLRAFMGAHLSQLPSPWDRDVVTFANPTEDSKWAQYIADLTPSILMITIDTFSEQILPPSAASDIDLRSKLLSIALHALKANVTVVDIAGMAVNMCAVHSYVITPRMFEYAGWDLYLRGVWPARRLQDAIEQAGTSPAADIAGCSSLPQLWARIIIDALSTSKPSQRSDRFETLASAVLLAAVVSETRGVHRSYLPEKRLGQDVITDRRLLMCTASRWLRAIEYQFQSGRGVSARGGDGGSSRGEMDVFQAFPVKLADLWDGRLIVGIVGALNADEEVLPYRLQEKFALLHSQLEFSKSPVIDMSDRLIEPPIYVDRNMPLIGECPLVAVESRLVAQFAPDVVSMGEKFAKAAAGEKRWFDAFQVARDWKMGAIIEEFMKPVDKPTELDAYQEKRRNRQRQITSRWYEFFAQSLEGRGSNLLVDFSSKPRGSAAIQDEMQNANGLVAENGEGGVAKGEGKQMKKHGAAGGKGGGGGKKTSQPSMREKILEESKKEKEKKLVKGEREQIRFACGQQRDAIAYLENLMSKLELRESRARCVYEQALLVARVIVEKYAGEEKREERRQKAVNLVGLIKQLFTVYRDHLDDAMLAEVTDLWVQLGFEKSPRRTASSFDAKLSLGMNMIDYQLAYGGQLIDIQSDPRKDDRVTGFLPDKWQRDMLNAVDKNRSAVIIAPTSAGKTFVSYYCIEKVLRSSNDDDIVVYVSPTKALLNQVCGSVYARFRNKPLSGGRSLFGTYTNEFRENVDNCHILITIPQCLDRILLSASVDVQRWVRRVKYVIFDEVHCISASPDAHVWEHLLLLIQCPFLALSATIGNAETLHQWLKAAERSKSIGAKDESDQVELIVYGERYSELELQLQRIPPSAFTHRHQPGDDDVQQGQQGMGLDELMPFGVYVPEKLRMFRIPGDQQLTARQILELYRALAEHDEQTRKELEPSKFFGYLPQSTSADGVNRVWLSRANLRDLESQLKSRFMHWLDAEPQKMSKILDKLGANIKDQIECRATPFEQRHVALDWIAPLIDELRVRNKLPAICFNDDRRMCERLALRLHETLERRQREYEDSEEFKMMYAVKDEEKMAKQQRRKRDEKEKKKTGKKKRGPGGKDDDDKEDVNREELDVAGGDVETDRLAAMLMRKKQALSKFKLFGPGKDDDLYKGVTERLSRAKTALHAKQLLALFERGIGYHHPGLAAVERNSVEILFRSGHLAVVFATSTLALGINMPCKTVMFGVDNQNLTPLQFRQMSGRAGRRGFDHSGDVVFMAIPTSKIRRLLTASLSMLRGNVPFTSGFVLRLLAFVDVPVEQQMAAIVGQGGAGGGGKQQLQHVNVKRVEAAIQESIDQRLRIALALLRNSFASHTLARARGENLQKQLQYFFGFSVQLLRWLELLDDKARPIGFAQLATHLHEHEPGNLVFIYLLQRGALHELCSQMWMQKKKLKDALVLLCAHLFTRRRLPKQWDPARPDTFPSKGESKIFLEPLPKQLEELIKQYNGHVDMLMKAFLQQATEHHSLQDASFAVAGHEDKAITVFSTELIRPLHDAITFDEAFVPAFAYPLVDHRQRKVHLNAYAVDFWRHQSKRNLERDNNINERETWTLIHDFSITLEHIATGLESLGPKKDLLVDVMGELSEEYGVAFRKAFGMKQKF